MGLPVAEAVVVEPVQIDEGKDRTVSCSFEGNHYEIDLSDDYADALREA